MSNEPHRESCRRSHRIIGNYLALTAWQRGLDCIVLDRYALETFLGLRRFKSSRVEWLKSDLRPWFLHQEAYYRTSSPSSISSLFLARVPISAHLQDGSMTTEQRIARMGPDAPRTGAFLTEDVTVPDEAEIVASLAVLAAGLTAPVTYSLRT